MPAKRTFDKPALTIEQQIELLESRGLCVEDKDFACKVLSNVNYYHLEGYWYSFYDKEKPGHQFYPNVSFSQIVRYFEFDNDLRMLLFAAISRIELSFRTRFIYELATEYGAFPLKKENFNFKTESSWTRSYEKLLEDISHSKEEYIIHYQKTYEEEIPPIWIMGELMTFGELSTWYDKFFRSPIRKRISLFYGLQPEVLTSWLRVLSSIRNICAHHDRLWNKILPFEIMIPKHIADSRFNGLFVVRDDINFNSRRIFNPLIAMQYLLNQIGLDKENSLLSDVCTLMRKYHIENYRRMGMPRSLETLISRIPERQVQDF